MTRLWLRVLLCVLPALGLVFAAQAAGWLRTLERHSWDARVRLLARPSAGTDLIRIIALDQSSLRWGEEENGLRWPWPREMYGLLLDFCRRAGAATVSFDVIFSEPSFYGPEDDRALARAGAANGCLALAFMPGALAENRAVRAGDGKDASSPARTEWRLAPFDFSAPGRAILPTPEVLAGAATLGMVSQLPDEDGVFRALRPVAFFGGRPAPALSLAAWLLSRPGSAVALEKDALVIRSPEGVGPIIPLDAERRAILNFRGGSGTYATYSAAAVMQSELRLREGKAPVLSPEALRGRHVLFGFTAPALLDLRPAPTDGAFAGVELHATALDNLLADDFIRPFPSWLAVPLAAALSLLVALLALRAANMRQLGAVALLVPALPAGLALGAYRALYWLPFMPVFLAAVLSLAFAVALAYATEGRQRRFLKKAFSRYVSPEVISQILREPDRLRLGGEKRVLSIYFSDLAGFSSLAESLAPEDLTRLLNDYLSLMSDIILEEGGTIDKYEGDAVIAFWNAPQTQEDHARRALRAALRCRDALAAAQPRFRALAGRDLTMRIGLHTGPAVVGNMGSRSRFDYTMLGDAVNLASRLEGANKVFGTQIMVSQAAFEAAGGEFAGRELALLRVVGRREAVRVFELMRPEEAGARVLEPFARALKAFQAGDIAGAGEIFARLAPLDAPSAVYGKRCAEAPDPLPPDWTGVWELTDK
jgi:adenylate cyclase